MKDSLSLAVLAGVLVTVCAYIETGPQNQAVIIGGDVYLRCQASGNDTRVQWWEYATSSSGALISDGIYLSPSHPNFIRYSLILDNPGQFDLYITGLVAADGGYYQCQDTNAAPPDTVVLGAQLVAIESPPNCTTTMPPAGTTVIEGDYFTMECIMFFKASMGVEPLMTWTGPDPFAKAYTPTNTSVWSGISFTVRREMEAQAYTCLTNFTEKGFNNPDSATNIPSYAYTFRSPQILVSWPPKNMYSSPSYDSYEVGQTITCFVDAFPMATIYWQSLRTSEVWNSESFVVRADMVGNQTMRCHAENLINGIQYYSDYFIILYVNPVPTTQTAGPSTTTTTAPAEDYCYDLTGRWEASNPKGVLCIWLDFLNNGVLTGLFKNATNTYYADIYGRAQVNTFDQGGFSSVWPGTLGVSGHVFECKRCYGVETLVVSQILRSDASAASCGDAGVTEYPADYTFYRVSNSPPCTAQPTF